MNSKPIMPRLSQLPEQLRYLQPFRKRFANRPPENTGVGPLFALLQKRIEGLTATQAENLLKEDGAALQSWLSEPEQSNDCLHFASVFLSMMESSELVAHVLEHTRKLAEPQPVAEMDLPEGAKLRKDISGEAANTFADLEGRRGAGDADVEIEASPVRFGEVSGTKFVRKGESWRGPYKEVRYVLFVPGGHIYASASPFGKRGDESKWDESELETHFHTLRVVRKLSD